MLTDSLFCGASLLLPVVQPYVSLRDSTAETPDICKRLLEEGLLIVEKRRDRHLEKLVADYLAAEQAARTNRVSFLMVLVGLIFSCLVHMREVWLRALTLYFAVWHDMNFVSGTMKVAYI